MKPIPQPCHHCGTHHAEAICPACREERPAFSALKRITGRASWPTGLTPYPTCRYFPSALCGCEERGICLEAA